MVAVPECSQVAAPRARRDMKIKNTVFHPTQLFPTFDRQRSYKYGTQDILLHSD